jgi:amino acid transporter
VPHLGTASAKQWHTSNQPVRARAPGDRVNHESEDGHMDPRTVKRASLVSMGLSTLTLAPVVVCGVWEIGSPRLVGAVVLVMTPLFVVSSVCFANACEASGESRKWVKRIPYLLVLSLIILGGVASFIQWVCTLGRPNA